MAGAGARTVGAATTTVAPGKTADRAAVTV
jgi:hypothetical protein